MIKQLIVFLVLINTGSTLAFAQNYNRSQLEQERADIQRQIERVTESIKETKRNRIGTVHQLELLQRKLKLREQAIQNINQQIGMINVQVNHCGKQISLLRQELDTLKLSYERSVLNAYKNRISYDYLNFIFSATSFNDALSRISYLKSYHKDRERQKAEILNRQGQLGQNVAELKLHREDKNLRLKAQETEKSKLIGEKREKDILASKLKSYERKLNSELARKLKRDSKLKAAIVNEIKKKGSVPAINSAKPNKINLNSNSAKPKDSHNKIYDAFGSDDMAKLSNDFEKNRKKLPWPVKIGKVVVEFGPYRLENSGLSHDNPGITIETRVGTAVKVIFDGDVSAVFGVEENLAIIVRHGRFLSTYSGLDSVRVSIGQHVQMGHVLGTIGEKTKGIGELEFIITNEKNINLSPRQWLR